MDDDKNFEEILKMVTVLAILVGLTGTGLLVIGVPLLAHYLDGE